MSVHSLIAPQNYCALQMGFDIYEALLYTFVILLSGENISDSIRLIDRMAISVALIILYVCCFYEEGMKFQKQVSLVSGINFSFYLCFLIFGSI